MGYSQKNGFFDRGRWVTIEHLQGLVIASNMTTIEDFLEDGASEETLSLNSDRYGPNLKFESIIRLDYG